DVASKGGDAVIRLWDVPTGNQLRVLQGNDGESFASLFFSPDNKTLASEPGMGGEKVVRLWDVASGKLLHKLEHPADILAVSLSPDGKTLASGGKDKKKGIDGFKRDGNASVVRLWDVATGKLLRTLEGHQHFITALSYSPDGKVLASGSGDRTIRLWDATTGKELHKLKCEVSTTPFSLSFSPDSKVLASVGHSALQLWDVTTGQELHHKEVHTGWVYSVSFAPDGRTVATAAASGGDDTVRLWNGMSGKPLCRLEHPGGAHSVVISPDGKTLA